MNLTGNKILITGGATGIGFGLAKKFSEAGNKIIICGRRSEKLEDAQKQLTDIIIFQCDVTLENERQKLKDFIALEHPDTNVLINNAGIQQWINIDDEDFMSRSLTEINTNIVAPIALTKLFIELPKINTILNVTSGLSFSPLIKTPVYSATKAFFHSFTLSLRALLKARNIEVIEIIPPAINTDLGGVGLHDNAPPVKDFIDSIFNQLAEKKDTLTFGLSENLSKANFEQLPIIFQKMNEIL